MKRLLAATLISTNVYAAELISQHDEDPAAKSAGINYLHDKGCTHPKIARFGKFQLLDNGDNTLTLIETFKFTCLEWIASPPEVVATPSYSSVLLSYKAPTTRANGSPLATNEIHHYTIYRSLDGVLIEVGTTSALNYTIQNLGKDTYYFAISTTDINGLEGEVSETVSVTIN